MTDTVRPPRWRRHPDPRDRLIIALYAQLEAERQTRETLRWAIRHGALKAEVLEAIAGDPVPADGEDLAALERSIALRDASHADTPSKEMWR
ncbi:MAG: hypothetical protein KUL88_01135 [Rhizobium sp.]|nr:hypothetical protein [Rhizobium sp.]